MKRQKGFELIEIMIVVAIVAILSAIAIPAYIDYNRESLEKHIVEQEKTQGIYQIIRRVCDESRCVITIEHDDTKKILAADRVRILNPEE